MNSRGKTLVALPAYNEANVIQDVLGKLLKLNKVDIIVIDDGSSDKTRAIVHQLGVKTISHACNRGAGAASQTAIEYARNKYFTTLILMDADNQHHISDIERLAKAINDDVADILIGNRFGSINNEVPISRIIFNKIANRMTNLFCTGVYQDTQSGFRALNKKAIDKLNLKVDGFGFCSEMIIVGEQLNLRIHEIPIHVDYTDYSLSKGQSFGKGIVTAFQFIWRIIFR